MGTKWIYSGDHWSSSLEGRHCGAGTAGTGMADFPRQGEMRMLQKEQGGTETALSNTEDAAAVSRSQAGLCEGPPGPAK